MKAPMVIAVSMLLLFANIAASKRRVVPIEDAPETELCKSTAQAMKELRKGFRGLYGKFRDPQTRVAGELQVAGLMFHALHTRTFETVDRQGVAPGS